MEHDAFSLKTQPYTQSDWFILNLNPVNFHSLSGEGYQFAGEILREMNESNPQVASRLIDPLLKFKKYDEIRQSMIKEELLQLQALDNLAKDLFEKVNKALEM